MLWSDSDEGSTTRISRRWDLSDKVSFSTSDWAMRFDLQWTYFLHIFFMLHTLRFLQQLRIDFIAKAHARCRHANLGILPHFFCFPQFSMLHKLFKIVTISWKFCWEKDTICCKAATSLCLLRFFYDIKVLFKMLETHGLVIVNNWIFCKNS
jgi:TRAP-type mannitol/chloroaromatic compound transport system permease small subunit